MIYYAKSHEDGASKLSLKYHMRYIPHSEYISEKDFQRFALFPDRDKLFYSVQNHESLHAYTLADLRLYFHPDGLLPIVSDVYSKFFKNLI